ncbi:MAG: hypothetical protein Tsb0021_12960 [Chlamydiales bacterium]
MLDEKVMIYCIYDKAIIYNRHDDDFLNSSNIISPSQLFYKAYLYPNVFQSAQKTVFQHVSAHLNLLKKPLDEIRAQSTT